MATVRDIIRERRDPILYRWAAVAQWAEPSRGLSRAELLDVLPEYADALARGADDAERAALVASHLRARVRLGSHAREVVEGLALLGRCIAEECGPEPASPEAGDRDALRDEIQTADVLETFAAHMVEDEQDDKRSCREIEQLARAQRREAVPIARALRELLAVAASSIGAGAAALVVHRSASEPPVAWASVGAAAGALERVATGELASALRTRVLRSRRPQQTQDLAADAGAGVAEAGIASILGARLRPQHELTGALYVGLGEPRPFAAREVRRAEMLGERLLLHAAAALGDDALRRANEQLRAERASQEDFVARLAHELRVPLAVARAASWNVSVASTCDLSWRSRISWRASARAFIVGAGVGARVRRTSGDAPARGGADVLVLERDTVVRDSVANALVAAGRSVRRFGELRVAARAIGERTPDVSCRRSISAIRSSGRGSQRSCARTRRPRRSRDARLTAARPGAAPCSLPSVADPPHPTAACERR